VVSVFSIEKLPKKPDIERNRELIEFCLEILGFYFRNKTGLSCVEYLVVNVLLNGPAGPSDITWFYKKLGLKISPRTVRRVIHDLRIKGTSPQSRRLLRFKTRGEVMALSEDTSKLKAIYEKGLLELSEEDLSEIEKVLSPLCRGDLRRDIWVWITRWFSKARISPVSTSRVLKRLREESEAGVSEEIARLVLCEYRSSGYDVEPYRGDLEKCLGVELPSLVECDKSEWSLSELVEKIKSITGEIGFNNIIEILEKTSGITHRVATITIELGIPVEDTIELLKPGNYHD
jgi:hypothetical protein